MLTPPDDSSKIKSQIILLELSGGKNIVYSETFGKSG